MPEFARLTECSDFPELEFLERESTPEPTMKLGIHLHLAGLSLLDTVSALASLGVERCWSTVHNWIQKADLQPVEGRIPNHVAVDETVIQVNDQRYWLFAAVEPATNRLRTCDSIRAGPPLSPRCSFLNSARIVEDALFLVDGAPWLQAACHRHGLRFRHETHGNRNAVERVFKDSNAERRRLSTISGTRPPKPQKHGCKRSRFAGTS